MALTGERVQKMSAEAFSRLKNDHEQFLEAYEKPTQIYRFLQARHSFKSLFMHRNLSYMQHRKERRKKRTSRLCISDLLKYRKTHPVERKDLPSQIKSDNFLQITFHDLERGIDFEHLLSAALTGDVRSEPPVSHAPSLMEVEVLLYNCHQHISEATSCPCTSVSLGKFEVEYTPSKNAKVVNSNGSCVSSHTLTIPESRLVWRGHKGRTAGSLMLVFHARAAAAAAGAASRDSGTQQRKSPLSSYHPPPQLAKVSVEVNRMNHSDIARARQTSAVQQEKNCASNGDLKLESTSTTQSATRESDSNKPPESQSCVEWYGSHRKAPRKTRSSNATKVRRDACTMTDLSLGTGSTPQTDIPNSNTHSGERPAQSDPTPSPPSIAVPRKGFTETNTSALCRKLALPLRNGLNGLSFHNGLHSEDHHLSPHTHNGTSSTHLDQNPSHNCSLTVSIPCSTAYQNGSTTTTGDSENSGSDVPCQAPPMKQRYKIPARKRSEIQLLLDGNKPPEQRINAEDVPVITAEDPSDRASSQNQQSKVFWTQLGTGARKSAPLEPVPHSVVCPAGDVGQEKTQEEGGGVKRSLSETEVAEEGDGVSSPPPAKMARISDTETTEKPRGDASGVKEIHKREEIPTDSAEAEMETANPPLTTQPSPNSHPHTLTEESDNSTTGKEPTASATGTTTVPEGLFCAEMVVFDSRGECLLDKGEYSILMQKCPERDEGGLDGQPPLVTFSPLSWSSVFGASEQERVQQSESMMLKLSLSWTHGPPKHRLISELETALDLQRLRNDYFVPTKPKKRVPKTHSPVTTASPLSSAPTTSGTPADTTAPLEPHPPPTVSSSLESTKSCSTNTTTTTTVAGGDAERDMGCTTEGGHTGKQEREPSEQKKDEERNLGHQDMEKTSRDDLEEYFTANETSAASSVADSTEMTLCTRPTPPPVTTAVEKGGGGGGGRTVYNFLYNNSTLQQTEPRGNMQCPWCSLACRHLYSLLKHMSLCHPRFLFTYTPVEGGSVIDVHVNKMYEASGQTSMERDPVERSGMSLRQRWKGPLKCLPCTAILVERHEELDEDLSEFLNDGSWKRGYNVKRQYYHSSTCLPMVPEEIDADSEAVQESIDRWQKTCSQKMIDDFTDVNRGEKEMMKLWNLFAMEHGMIADKQISTACMAFVREKGSEIAQNNHTNSCLAHLVSMCEFGLIPPSVIKTCMDTLLTAEQQQLSSSHTVPQTNTTTGPSTPT